jgi:hypothetical protein
MANQQEVKAMNDLMADDLKTKLAMIKQILAEDGKIILINAIWITSIFMALPLMALALLLGPAGKEIVPFLALDALAVILTTLYRINRRFKYKESDSH